MSQKTLMWTDKYSETTRNNATTGLLWFFPARHLWNFRHFHGYSLAGVEIKVTISCSLRVLRIRLPAIGLSKIHGIQLKLHQSLD